MTIKRVKPEKFLQSILAGYYPNTGEIIPNNSPFKHSEVIEEIKEFLETNRFDSKIISDEHGNNIMDGDLFEKLRKKRMKIAEDKVTKLEEQMMEVHDWREKYIAET